MIDGVTHLMSAFQAFRQQGIWTERRTDNIVDGGAPFYRLLRDGGRQICRGRSDRAALLRQLSSRAWDWRPPTCPTRTTASALAGDARAFRRSLPHADPRRMDRRAAGRDVCLAPALSIDEAAGHPHMRARGAHVAFDGVTHPAPAPRFGLTPSTLRRPAPRPGQDSRQALAEWGMTPAEIETLEAAGAMAQT